VDHVALVVLDDTALLGEVDQLAQLDLRRERPYRKPLPGVNAFPMRISSEASGLSTRPSQRTIGADTRRRRTRAGGRCARSDADDDEAHDVMDRAVTIAATQLVSIERMKTSATSVVAVSSHTDGAGAADGVARRVNGDGCSAAAPRTLSRPSPRPRR